MYAIVIAGGKAERLRPLTDDRPKHMLPVLEKPILEHHIEWLRDNGATDIILACGHLANVIQDYFDDGARWGVSISYSVETQSLGRGGALKLAAQQLPPGEPFVIGTNGDNINTQPLAPMIRQHQRTGAVATLMLVQLRSPYGIVRQRGSRITGFEEKPLLPHWLSAGVYVLQPEFFERCPDVGDHEDQLFPQLVEEGKLYAFRSKSYWKAIDTVKDLNEAGAYFASQTR